jgi:hypothetical protein
VTDETPGITAHRPLPPDLRDQLRVEFEQGIENRRRFPTPVVAAAAAVVLLAGTVFVLRQVPDPRTTGGATGPALDRAVATVALDRCWSAVRQRGSTAQFPDRSRWTPVFTVGDSQLGVVAARADGKPLFCQTTPTTATVSDPNAGPAAISATLFSREGVVAGSVDGDDLPITVKGPSGTTEVRADVRDHLFVALTGVNLTGADVIAGGDEHLRAPSPAVALRDHPDSPFADRVSPEGIALGDCLSRSAKPVVDPDSYEPGAFVSYPGGRFSIGRSPFALVLCRWGQVRGEATVRSLVLSGAPATFDRATALGNGFRVLTGELSEDTATLDIGFGGGPTLPASVARRTFAILVPADVDGSTLIRVVARGADGGVVFEDEWPFTG